MNERIKQMWTKVCQDEMPELDETCMTLQRQEKFAELLIWECAEIARLNTRVDSKVYLMIQEHFGVEE